MRPLKVAVRRLTAQTLAWFQAQATPGGDKAITINKEVFRVWRPDLVLPPANGTFDVLPDIRLRYFPSAQDGTLDVRVFVDPTPRTIKSISGNLRLGTNLPGPHFGLLRVDDLMVLVYDQDANTISWVCIRGAQDLARRAQIPRREMAMHRAMLRLLGAYSGGSSMWNVNYANAGKIVSWISHLYPPVTELLMSQRIARDAWTAALDAAGFQDTEAVGERLMLSLQAKPFVILTGLSGSGKTLIAQAFASWMSQTPAQYEVVAVGADWTGTDNIVGYPDALNATQYVRRPALNLMLRANEPANQEKPYFLVLDEMNLSHVERYFADVLSALESDGSIFLHGDQGLRSGVPDTIRLPRNLFIVGTVNVDETTYTFSPKVLDRANVIEFRTPRAAMERYLDAPGPVNVQAMLGGGTAHAAGFLSRARGEAELADAERTQLRNELLLFFSVLEDFGMEFGFRTAKEIVRYAFFQRDLNAGQPWQVVSAMDVQLLQKILPRLHGSTRKMRPVLAALSALCFNSRQRNAAGSITNEAGLKDAASAAARNGWSEPAPNPPVAAYPLSYAKLKRMSRLLEANGFVSFAEA